MRTKVQKWGNSLAVRIPRAFAAELGLEPESHAELTVEDGRFVLRPNTNESLQALVDGITPRNRHAAQDFGAPVGREAW